MAIEIRTAVGKAASKPQEVGRYTTDRVLIESAGGEAVASATNGRIAVVCRCPNPDGWKGRATLPAAALAKKGLVGIETITGRDATLVTGSATKPKREIVGNDPSASFPPILDILEPLPADLDGDLDAIAVSLDARFIRSALDAVALAPDSEPIEAVTLIIPREKGMRPILVVGGGGTAILMPLNRFGGDRASDPRTVRHDALGLVVKDIQAVRAARGMDTPTTTVEGVEGSAPA